MLRRLAPSVLCVWSVVLAVPAASAEPTTFNFQDPKGVNGIVFILDSDLEPIVGVGGGLSGDIVFDPADPESFTGSIRVPASGLRVVNDKMTEVMHGDDWLDVTRNVDITVEFDEVLEAEQTEGDQKGVLLLVKGRLLFGPVELTKEFEILATHLAGAAADRGGAKEGDLLVLRSEFTVSRSDLGIKPEMGPEKVADEVHVIVPIVGYSE